MADRQLNESDPDRKGLRIGLFDSGAGGLSVLRQLVLSGVEASYVYIADAARCPYGNRSAEEITAFAEQSAKWLAESAVDRIVMACNTSAAIAGNSMRNRIPVPMYDLIRPAALHCAGYKSVAILATSATCRSKAFSLAINAMNPAVAVSEIACPELVPLVEGGHLNDELADEAVQLCLRRLGAEKVDAVVLGCTHFPFLKEAFARQLGQGIALVDPAEHLRLELFNDGASVEAVSLPSDLYKRCTFFTTGCPDSFARTAALCLGLDLDTFALNVCGISVNDLSSLAGPSAAAASPSATFACQPCQSAAELSR